MISDLVQILMPYKPVSHAGLKPEQKICVEFANAMRELSLGNKLPFIWFHVPNEFIPPTRKNYSFDLKQKHMGKITGTPDYCFVGKERSFFIEFKAGKAVQTPQQKLFDEWCDSVDVEYLLYRSSQSAIKGVLERIF